jgi:hypothetical protein
MWFKKPSTKGQNWGFFGNFGLLKTWQSSQKNAKISLIYTTQNNPRYSQFFLKKETKFVRKSGWSEQVLWFWEPLAKGIHIPYQYPLVPCSREWECPTMANGQFNRTSFFSSFWRRRLVCRFFFSGGLRGEANEK